MSSLYVPCAHCGKLVITKHKSKQRTCSMRCYMTLYRRKLKEEAALIADSLEATLETQAA